MFLQSKWIAFLAAKLKNEFRKIVVWIVRELPILIQMVFSSNRNAEVFIVVMTRAQQSTVIYGYGNVLCAHELFTAVFILLIFVVYGELGAQPDDIKIEWPRVSYLDIFIFHFKSTWLFFFSNIDKYQQRTNQKIKRWILMLKMFDFNSTTNREEKSQYTRK